MVRAAATVVQAAAIGGTGGGRRQCCRCRRVAGVRWLHGLGLGFRGLGFRVV
jgi:hypothetical protein